VLRYEILWLIFLAICVIGCVGCYRRRFHSGWLLLASIGFAAKAILLICGTTGSLLERYSSESAIVESALAYSDKLPYIEVAALGAIVLGIVWGISGRKPDK